MLISLPALADMVEVVTVIILLNEKFGKAQLFIFVILTLTWSLFCNVVLEKMGLFVPAVIPFTCH